MVDEARNDRIILAERAIRALGGGARVRLVFAGRVGVEANGARLAVRGALEASPSYQSIILYVDASTFQVRQVPLLDAQGNRNRFDFLNPEINAKTPGGEFNFTPPPGTQVIRP